MKKLLLKFSIYILNKFGSRVETNLNEQSEEIEAERLSNVILTLQNEISFIRAEIINKQGELLNNVEPTLFQKLANSDEPWVKNTTTKFWIDSIGQINNLIQKHESLIKDLETNYMNLNRLQ